MAELRWNGSVTLRELSTQQRDCVGLHVLYYGLCGQV